MSVLAEKEETLTSKLNDEEKVLFVSYTSTYNDFLTVSIADSFIIAHRKKRTNTISGIEAVFTGIFNIFYLKRFKVYLPNPE